MSASSRRDFAQGALGLGTLGLGALLGGAALAAPGGGGAGGRGSSGGQPYDENDRRHANMSRAVAEFALTRNHIWTGVMLEGHGAYPFLIDTGATWYMVDPALADQIGLKLTGDKDRQHTAAGVVDLPIYSLKHIIVGGGIDDSNLTIVGLREDRNDITHGAVPLPTSAVFDVNFDTRKLTVSRQITTMPEGYVAFDLLNSHGRQGTSSVVGDPGSTRMGADSGSSGSSNGSQNITEQKDGASHISRVLKTRQPIVWASLDGQPVRLMVDSGEQGGIYLYPHYVRAHGLWDHYPKFLPSVDRTIGGDVKTRLVRPDQVAFGKYVFKRPVVTLADPTGAGDLYDMADGIIGVETLRRLNFIHDPSRYAIAFKPSGMFDDVWRYDRAGLTIDRVDKTIQIVDVAEGGPAWKSGLRKGDEVTGWTGAAAVKDSGPYFSLLWALQGEPGSQLGVQIANGAGGKPEVVAVTLEERI